MACTYDCLQEFIITSLHQVAILCMHISDGNLPLWASSAKVSFAEVNVPEIPLSSARGVLQPCRADGATKSCPDVAMHGISPRHTRHLSAHNHHGRRNAHQPPTREATHREHCSHHIAHHRRQQKRAECAPISQPQLPTSLMISPGPSHRRLQAEARQRHPRLAPATGPAANPLRRKLRPGTPREIQDPPALHPLAHDRWLAIEQM